MPTKKSMELRLHSASDALALSRMGVPAANTAPFVGLIQWTTGDALVAGALVEPLTATCTKAEKPRAPTLSTATACNWKVPDGAFVHGKVKRLFVDAPNARPRFTVILGWMVVVAKKST